MKIYLAGPMRGYPLYNFPAFHAAAKKLRGMGHEVWSPAEWDLEQGFNPATDEAKPLAFYMKFELPQVCDSDAVVVLEGWRSSKGANLEVHVANEVGVPVHEMSQFVRLADGNGRRKKGNREAAAGVP